MGWLFWRAVAVTGFSGAVVISMAKVRLSSNAARHLGNQLGIRIVVS